MKMTINHRLKRPSNLSSADMDLLNATLDKLSRLSNFDVFFFILKFASSMRGRGKSSIGLVSSARRSACIEIL